TYTAKTAAGVLDGLAEQPGGVHLFWHTLSAVTPEPPAEVTLETLPHRFRRHFHVAGGGAGSAA
ncbi:MAG: hypothetical protein GWN71_09590, partial [Gammaproteobacteria bacterium]|nr:hypothetical protein [Gemmatimonadota bacterium]NIU73816.1 hypothetical protein [Gammaproteobacteria bacterium]